MIAISTISSRVQDCWPQRRSAPSSTVKEPDHQIDAAGQMQREAEKLHEHRNPKLAPADTNKTRGSAVRKPDVAAIAAVRAVMGRITSMSERGTEDR
jgi:hypothetical protein